MSKAGQHQAPIRAGILSSNDRIETINEFLSSFAILGFLGGACDQFPFAQPPLAAAGAAVVAGEAGVDFFNKGDCTWNLFPALGDVGLSNGDFTWNGDPTLTVAIFLLIKKSLDATMNATINNIIG